jgi:hypothetical protein
MFVREKSVADNSSIVLTAMSILYRVNVFVR